MQPIAHLVNQLLVAEPLRGQRKFGVPDRSKAVQEFQDRRTKECRMVLDAIQGGSATGQLAKLLKKSLVHTRSVLFQLEDEGKITSYKNRQGHLIWKKTAVVATWGFK